MIWNLPNKKINLKLLPGEVHVWRANLPSQENKLSDYYQILSDEERTRADRFKFAKHRRRFIAAKAILRNILAAYLEILPQQLKYEYGEHGKPRVQASQNAGIEFNQSDSHDYAIYALALRREVGVDIEFLRDDVAAEELTQRFMSSNEYKQLNRLPDSRKQAAFFKLWTCKEAFLKAIGKGLLFPLNEFDIDISQDKPRLVSINDPLIEVKAWQLQTLEVAEDYAAALVVAGDIQDLKLWEWSS